MITFDFVLKNYPCYKDIIDTIQEADELCNRAKGSGNEKRAFFLYRDVWLTLVSCFSDRRCVPLVPYVSNRLFECYLYGVGVEQDLGEALCYLDDFRHITSKLPHMLAALNLPKDPNQEQFEILGKQLMLLFNKESEKHGFVVCLCENRILIFSKFRLPFETDSKKNPHHKIFRNSISKIVSRFPRLGGKMLLHARYGTLDEKKGFYDLENVLFYNFGFTKRSMEHRVERGVAFSRIPLEELEKLQSEKNVPPEFCHCYEYLADEAPHAAGERERLIAEWDALPFVAIKSANGVLNYWKAMRGISEGIAVRGNVCTKDKKSRFSLYLEIEKPKEAHLYALSIVKPLLDGIVSALHTGDFDEDETLRFSEKLNVPIEWIKNNNRQGVLGERKYIQLYSGKSGIKWNPADDLCDKVSISVVDGKEWRVGGRVYAVVPCC